MAASKRGSCTNKLVGPQGDQPGSVCPAGFVPHDTADSFQKLCPRNSGGGGNGFPSCVKWGRDEQDKPKVVQSIACPGAQMVNFAANTADRGGTPYAVGVCVSKATKQADVAEGCSQPTTCAYAVASAGSKTPINSTNGVIPEADAYYPCGIDSDSTDDRECHVDRFSVGKDGNNNKVCVADPAGTLTYQECTDQLNVLSPGVIAAIVIGSVAGLVVLILLLRWAWNRRRGHGARAAQQGSLD